MKSILSLGTAFGLALALAACGAAQESGAATTDGPGGASLAADAVSDGLVADSECFGGECTGDECAIDAPVAAAAQAPAVALETIRLAVDGMG